MQRRPYPSDVSDEAWAFVMPYLMRMPLEAQQRKYDLREVCNALRWLVKTGAQWEYLPHDFPPPRSSARRPSAGCGGGCSRSAWLARNPRVVRPSPVRLFMMAVSYSPAPGAGRARCIGRWIHWGICWQQERAQVAELSKAVQTATKERAGIAFVDQGYTGFEAESAAARAVGDRAQFWLDGALPSPERLAETLRGFHWLAFSILLLPEVVDGLCLAF